MVLNDLICTEICSLGRLNFETDKIEESLQCRMGTSQYGLFQDIVRNILV